MKIELSLRLTLAESEDVTEDSEVATSEVILVNSEAVIDDSGALVVKELT